MKYGELNVDNIVSMKAYDGFGNVIMDLMTGEEYVSLSPIVVVGGNQDDTYISKELAEKILKKES